MVKPYPTHNLKYKFHSKIKLDFFMGKCQIQFRIFYVYLISGENFLCSLAICPVRSRDGAIALYIIDFDDPSWKEDEDEEKNTNTTCKFNLPDLSILGTAGTGFMSMAVFLSSFYYPYYEQNFYSFIFLCVHVCVCVYVRVCVSVYFVFSYSCHTSFFLNINKYQQKKFVMENMRW